MGFLRRLFGGDRSDAVPAEEETGASPTWSQLGEGPFDVEKIPGEWHFQITFDDAIAHEEEDHVAAFVEQLAAAAGVNDAAHEDREVILVKARGMSQAQLQATAERIWSAVGGGTGEA